MDIKGLTVKKVLVDPGADIRKEIYLGMVLDRASRRVVVMASSRAGWTSKRLADSTPEKIITVAVDPFLGLREYQARDLALSIRARPGTNGSIRPESVRACTSATWAVTQPWRR